MMGRIGGRRCGGLFGSLAAMCLVVGLGSSAQPAMARPSQTTFLVTNAGDSGPGSLRRALVDANTAALTDRVTISFDIPGCGGPCRIHVVEALPEISRGDLLLDGYSQPGAAPGLDLQGGTILIELVGPGPAGPDGLRITGPDVEVRGLAVHGFGGNGVVVTGDGARRVVVAGNYLGLDSTGAVSIGNGRAGIAISGGARQVRVGGPVTAEGNVISGNVGEGVAVLGDGTGEIEVIGNFIGTDVGGFAAQANVGSGVLVAEGASGESSGLSGGEFGILVQDNLISGNQADGVRVDGASTSAVRVVSNLIGRDSLNNIALSNGGDGVHVMNGAHDILITTSEDGQPNVIAGNFGHGVQLERANNITIRGAFIGTGRGGQTVMPNGGSGVRVAHSAGVTIGGSEAEGNLISGNATHGVYLSGDQTMNAIISGNRIGTNLDGNESLPNGGDGVRIAGGARNNLVGAALGEPAGGFDPPEGNLISGNVGDGVVVLDAGSTDNLIIGNRIGTTQDGAAALGNEKAGLRVAGGASFVFVGLIPLEIDLNRFARKATAGLTDSQQQIDFDPGNTISGNRVGVRIEGPDTRDVTLAENRIGTTADGSADIPNAEAGVVILGGAQNTHLGVDNTIAYNGADGILVDGADTFSHTFAANAIYENGGAGIALSGGANGGIEAPMLDPVVFPARRVDGTACAGCLIQLFANRLDDGEGRRYLADAVADEAGAFAFDLPAAEETFFTTTSTDDLGTSPFSNVVSAPPATPVPTATLVPPTVTSSAPATVLPTAPATATQSPPPTVTATEDPPSATPTAGGTPTAAPSPTTGASTTPMPTPIATPSPQASDTPASEPSDTPPATAPPTSTAGPATPEWRIHLPITRNEA